MYSHVLCFLFSLGCILPYLLQAPCVRTSYVRMTEGVEPCSTTTILRFFLLPTWAPMADEFFRSWVVWDGFVREKSTLALGDE